MFNARNRSHGRSPVRPRGGSTAAATLSLVSALTGCSTPQFEATKLGGTEVSATTLKQGYEAYQQYCRPCHGDKGDGKGYSSKGLRPPPRDFTQGIYKFGGVPAPALPPDSEFKRIVRGGLHGTAMLPWDLTDQEIGAVTQYIKTFAPRWQTETPGQVVAANDPNYQGEQKQKAVELGRRLYHVKAQCSAACHPNYVTHEELHNLTKEMNGAGQTEFSPDMYVGKLKESEYCLEWKPLSPGKKLEDRECQTIKDKAGEEHPVVAKVMPPDFTRDAVRAGATPNDLFRTIGSGIGGAGMPPWKGALTDEEIWGLVYYVRSLIEIKEMPALAALRTRLDDPANLAWAPPPPPVEPAPGAAAAPGTAPAAAVPGSAAAAAKPAVPGSAAAAAAAKPAPAPAKPAAAKPASPPKK